MPHRTSDPVAVLAVAFVNGFSNGRSPAMCAATWVISAQRKVSSLVINIGLTTLTWTSDFAGVVFAVGLSTALGFVIWLWTPRILLGAMDWRRLLPGATVSAVLGALLAAASGIYVPVLLTWSADKYGLIGVAFSIQSWLLAASFVVVVGAVVGAVASEALGDRLDHIGRRGAVRG